MRIELRIDRVVLDGIDVSPRHVRAVREALHAELTRLITRVPAASWQQSRRQRRIGAPALQVHPSSTPGAIGHGIARSVYGGLVAPAAPGAGMPAREARLGGLNHEGR